MAHIHAHGCITAHGPGVRTLVRAIDSGRLCPRRAPPDGVTHPVAGDLAGRPPASGWIDPIGPCPFVRREQRLRFGRFSRPGRLILIAIHDALCEAQRPTSSDHEHEHGGVVLGTAFGAHLANERFFRGLIDAERAASAASCDAAASPREFAQTLAGVAAAEAAIHLGLGGPNLTLAQGRGAGLAAVAAAGDLIDAGQAGWAVAGAVDTLGLTLLAALPRARPVDAPPAAEAAAVLALSSEPSGALATLAGAGSASGLDAARLASGEALDRASLAAGQIQSAWSFDPSCRRTASEREVPIDPLLRSVGDCFSVTPLLAAIRLLAADDSQRRRWLPALISVADAEIETVDALCLV